MFGVCVASSGAESAPASPLGGGLLAEDERGRVYVLGADGLLRTADARAVGDAARCVSLLHALPSTRKRADGASSC